MAEPKEQNDDVIANHINEMKAGEGAEYGGVMRFEDGRLFLPNRMMLRPLKEGVEFLRQLPDGRVVLRRKDKTGKDIIGFAPDQSFQKPTGDDLKEMGMGLVSKIMHQGAAKYVGMGMSPEFKPGVKEEDRGVRAAKMALEAAIPLVAIGSSMKTEPAPRGLPWNVAAQANLARATKVAAPVALTGAGVKFGEGMMPGEKPSTPEEIGKSALETGVGTAAGELALPTAFSGLKVVGRILGDIFPLASVGNVVPGGAARQFGGEFGEINTEFGKAILDSPIKASKTEIMQHPTLQSLKGAVSKLPLGKIESVPYYQRKYKAGTEYLNDVLGPMRADAGRTPRELGTTIAEGVESAQTTEKNLYKAGYEKFANEGGMVDASGLIDKIESHMEPGKKTAEYFNELAGPIMRRYGKMGKILPKFTSAEEINLEVEQYNQSVLKPYLKGFGIPKGTKLDQVDPKIFAQIKDHAKKAGLEVKDYLTDEQAYNLWKEAANKHLSEVPPTALDEVRKLFVDEANHSSGVKKFSAIQAKNYIDEVLNNTALEDSRMHYAVSMAMKDPKRMPTLARILNTKNAEDIALMFGTKSDSEIADIVLHAKQYNQPKVLAATRISYAGSALKDINYTGKYNFGLLSKNMGLDDTSTTLILRGKFDDPRIPDNLRTLFGGDRVGQETLRRLALIGELGKRSPEFNPSGTAYVSESVREITELAHLPTAEDKLGAVSRFASKLATHIGLARLFFSDAGTEWFLRTSGGLQGGPAKFSPQNITNTIRLLYSANKIWDAYNEGKSPEK